MRFLGYLVLSIAKVLEMFFNIYTLIVIVAVIISWVNPDPYNPIVRFLHAVTEPVFRFFRRLLPRALFRTGVDLTPIVVFAVIIFLDTMLVRLLGDLAHSLLSK